MADDCDKQGGNVARLDLVETVLGQAKEHQLRSVLCGDGISTGRLTIAPSGFRCVVRAQVSPV